MTFLNSLRLSGESDESDSMIGLERWLFFGCIAVYLVTRLVGLEHFPIYFFTDEAAQAVLASDLIKGGIRIDGQLLPTFFVNSEKFSLGASVYLQVLPTWLFGKSVLVTRVTAVLITLPGIIALSGILKRTFEVRHWWVVIPLLSVTPVWFIHSRTAFETVMATSLITVFIFFYLEYRHRSLNALYLALLAGAVAFYTYPPARLIVGSMGLMLAILDLPFHLQQGRVAFRAWWLLWLLALPYARFSAVYPGSEIEHLRLIDSVLIRPIGIGEKLGILATNYVQALNPMYWFLPNDIDLARHVMPGSGHLPLIMLPFAVIGLGLAIFRLREASYRTLLVALVAGPIGGSLAGPLVTRVLPTVVPLILLTALGLVWVLARLESQRFGRRGLAIVLFVALTGANFALLREALVNGPTWHDDYGLYGMQYGAPQVIGRVAEMLEAEPERPFIVSPWWLNGPGMIARFFLDDPEAVGWDSAARHVESFDPHHADTIFVMSAEDYVWIEESGLVETMDVLEVIDYPDGRAGFYFATIAYDHGNSSPEE